MNEFDISKRAEVSLAACGITERVEVVLDELEAIAGRGLMEPGSAKGAVETGRAKRAEGAKRPGRAEGAVFWNVPRSTGIYLNLLVKAAGVRKVLEIGTSNGYSGIFIAAALSHAGGVLYTVESHRERFGIARDNFNKAGLTAYIRQTLAHAPEVFINGDLKDENGFEMVFVDATKMEYISYLRAVMPKMAARCVLVADNCNTHQKELAGFIDFAEKSGFFAEVLDFDNGVLLGVREKGVVMR